MLSNIKYLKIVATS